MSYQETEKVKTKHHTYQRKNCHQATNSHKFAGSYLQLMKHKNQIRAVLLPCKSDREFHTIQVLSPSEARVMIGWLARYIALTDPDPISLAIASTKAHANGIVRQQLNIAKELGL
jgi:hypothetical protein